VALQSLLLDSNDQGLDLKQL